MTRFLNWLKEPANVLLAMLLAGMLAIVLVSSQVKAEGLKGPKSAANPFAAVAPSPAPFSGCGPSIHGDWTIGTVDNLSPVTLAAEGPFIGAGAFCDYTPTPHTLFGIFGDYSMAMGELEDLGVNSKIRLGGRAGVIMNGWMAYGGLAWVRLDVDGIGDVDGWEPFLGVETQIAKQTFLDIEAGRTFYRDVGGSSIDLNATSVRAALKVKFGGK
jgi:hypothetical protein